MVKTKRKLLPAIIAALCITLLSGGCGGSRSAPGDTGSESEGSAGSEGSGDAGSAMRPHLAAVILIRMIKILQVLW